MKRSYIYIPLAVLILSSCHRRRAYEDNDTTSEYVDNDRRSDNQEYREERSIRKGAKVYMEQAGGVYFVPITVNGLGLKFIFDTGASDITISQTEAQFLAKQGLLTQQDVIGKQQYQIADGSFSEGTIIRLKELTIGDRTINNVKASVIESQNAPLLLGQTALSEFGKVSLDYKNGYIIFE